MLSKYLMSAIVSVQVVLAPLAQAQSTEASNPLRTHFVYVATIEPTKAKNIDVWVPIPSDSPYQAITNLSVSSPAPFRIEQEQKYGNRMVYVQLPHASKGASVQVSFDAKRYAPSDVGMKNGNHADGYLTPDRLVPTDGRYAQIGREVAGAKLTPIEKMRAIYDHVVATMQYDYKKESPKLGEGDVAFVCDYKRGNCSDLHSYVISLARSQGIPCFLEYGFPISGVPVTNPLPTVGKIGGYHCWTWFYVGGKGWMPLDASDGRRWLDSQRPEFTEKNFGDLIVERSAVAVSRGRDIDLSPKQKGPSLNNFIYPYAESDGESISVAWEVNYQFLGTGEASVSQEQRLNDLLRIVAGQQELLNAMKTSAGKNPAAEPVASPSKEAITVYGQIRTDAIYDSNKPSPNNQFPFWIRSSSSGSSDQFGLHPRLTRLGLDFAAPADTMKGYDVRGKVELDFQGGGSESRQTPRARLLYATLAKGKDSWLVGQSWDLISPLFPSPNDDSLMWNAGNLGDRRPQIRYTRTESNASLAIAAGLTGAIDAKDLDGNGVRDGEESGAPNLQARLALTLKQLTLGIWGFSAQESAATAVAGATSWNARGNGVDLSWKVAPKTTLRGEWFSGTNLSDFRGGVGQGVNSTTGEEIDSKGGWVELGHQLSSKAMIAVGYSLDDPDDRDVPTGGRTKNRTWWIATKFSIGTHLELGMNYLDWRTDFTGADLGKDRRWNLYLSRKF